MSKPKDSWYLETGQGMGATLKIASEKKGYTLTDRATYLANQAALALDILVEKDAALLNVYHVITLSPSKCPKINLAGGDAFAKWIVSKPAQDLIAKFGVVTIDEYMLYVRGRYEVVVMNSESGEEEVATTVAPAASEEAAGKLLHAYAREFRSKLTEKKLADTEAELRHYKLALSDVNELVESMDKEFWEAVSGNTDKGLHLRNLFGELYNSTIWLGGVSKKKSNK
jgi:hypothetical protein